MEKSLGLVEKGLVLMDKGSLYSMRIVAGLFVLFGFGVSVEVFQRSVLHGMICAVLGLLGGWCIFSLTKRTKMRLEKRLPLTSDAIETARGKYRADPDGYAKIYRDLRVRMFLGEILALIMTFVGADMGSDVLSRIIYGINVSFFSYILLAMSSVMTVMGLLWYYGALYVHRGVDQVHFALISEKIEE